MKPFTSQIKNPARKPVARGLTALPARVMKAGTSQTVVGGVSRSTVAAGSRRLRGV
jgi:hypothetical protein